MIVDVKCGHGREEVFGRTGNVYYSYVCNKIVGCCTQGNLKSTRKARQSLFLSLYFWHKLIRLEPRKMRGGGLKFSQSLVMAPD